LDNNSMYSRALDGSEYLPGIVGLNNIKNNDSINVILQALVRVPMLRNFFIIENNYQECKSVLVHRFGELVRKIWNPRNFKGQVSPHELLQAISQASQKKFRIGVQSDPVDFLAWFLNELHRSLGGSKKKDSIITKCFQGKVQVSTSKKTKNVEIQPQISELMQTDETNEIAIVPFMYLSLDVPPPPLFKDEQEKNIIPQIPLYTLLEKFDGNKIHDLIGGESKTYILRDSPRYLILHIKRFTKNNWFIEKNPTIVNFPVKNLELRDYLLVSSESTVSATKYDLLANIKHEGQPNKGVYKVDVQNKGNEKWFEIQDLIVRETMPQLIALSEAYVQFYEIKANPSLTN